MIAQTEIDGQLPQLTKNDVIYYRDFKQEYTYRKGHNSNSHIVESNGRINYKNIGLDMSSKAVFEISHSERIEFNSCYDLNELSDSPSIVVEVKELLSKYDNGLKSLHFVQSHYIMPSNESNPCDNNSCSEFAACLPDKDGGTEYTCICKRGFDGDGYECTEENECISTESGYIHTCSDHATCINTPGSYECICNSPYVGNGKQCDLETPQIDQDICSSCHPNAKCVSIDGSSRCECSKGYYGNGYVCHLGKLNFY